MSFGWFFFKHKKAYVFLFEQGTAYEVMCGLVGSERGIRGRTKEEVGVGLGLSGEEGRGRGRARPQWRRGQRLVLIHS